MTDILFAGGCHHFFFEEALLKMKLPKRHATSLTGSRLAPLAPPVWVSVSLWPGGVQGPIHRRPCGLGRLPVVSKGGAHRGPGCIGRMPVVSSVLVSCARGPWQCCRWRLRLPVVSDVLCTLGKAARADCRSCPGSYTPSTMWAGPLAGRVQGGRIVGQAA